jgi:hypothetical protein
MTAIEVIDEVFPDEVPLVVTELRLRLRSSGRPILLVPTEPYGSVEFELAEVGTPEVASGEGPVAGREQRIVHKIGRLEYLDAFEDVWLGKEHFDLRGRTQARLCLEYLVAKQALTENSARHFADEIDPYVREKGGNCGRGKFSEIKIKQYFNDRKGRLRRLRSDLIRTVAGSGKYYLETGADQK